MDPNEYEELSDDEIEARQRAEDGETGDDTITGSGDSEGEAGSDGQDTTQGAGASAEGGQDDTQAGADGADTAAGGNGDTVQGAADTTAGAGAEGDGKPKVAGVASKDGKGVLPYQALQAARRDARRAETRAERAERELAEARQQIADMKAGKTPEAEVTEEDVQRMEADFPEEGRKMRVLFERAQAAAAATPDRGRPADDEPDLTAQEAIDEVPLLLEWQTSDPEKFARAVEHDAVLMKSPKWADKPVVDRFTEAARRTADEYDIEFPEPRASTSASAAPAAAKPNPAATAQRKHPETLSDFKGGSIADHGTLDVKRATPADLLGHMQGWSDEQIEAHLAKYG